MNIKLNVANINIIIENISSDMVPENFTPFVSDFEETKADILYRFSDVKQLSYKAGKQIIKNLRNEIYLNQNIYTKKSIIINEDGREYFYFTEFVKGEKEIKIYIPMDRISKKTFRLYFNNFLMFDYVIGWHNHILMHAAMVEYNNEVILFTGASGTGKSTQSDNWNKYMKAKIVNGDRAVLDVSDSTIKTYGSPYAGSSGIYINKGYKVRAIVFLSQEKENKIRKLDKTEAYKALFPRFSIVRWDKKAAEYFLSAIMKVIDNVSVYHLGCRPDREAVELTYNEIYTDSDIR